MCGGERGIGGVGESEVALPGGDGVVGGGEFVVVGEGREEVWERVGLGKEVIEQRESSQTHSQLNICNLNSNDTLGNDYQSLSVTHSLAMIYATT